MSAVRPRVRVREDSELTARLPARKSARVTLLLKDGRTSTHECENSRGGFDRPYELTELVAKFDDLAGRVLEPSGVTEVRALVERLDSLTRTSDLMDVLRRRSRES